MCMVFTILTEENMSNQLESTCNETNRKKIGRISSLYKNDKWFLGTFFLLVPLLYIPIFFNQDVFLVCGFILSGVIGIFNFFNIQTIVSTLQGSKNFSTSDYHNVLSVIEWMPKIQIRSGVIVGVSIVGIFLVPYFTITPFLGTIRLILFIIMIPSIIIAIFSSFHIILHTIGKFFDLNLSKAWIMSIKSESTDYDKMKNLMNCINNYNDFLHKLFKKRITNLDQLYMKFVLDTSKDLDIITKEVKEKLCQREFFLLIYLQEYKNNDGKTIVEIKSIKHALLPINAGMLKSISIIIGSGVSIIVSIIQILPIILSSLKIS